MFHARPDYEIRRVRGFSPRVTTHYSPVGRIEGTSRTLEIEFHHGVVYDSFDVPEDVYCDLLAAGSRGASRSTSGASTSTDDCADDAVQISHARLRFANPPWIPLVD